jgi:ring-1,2-phenylacetyl-CoA epoxidase subunit PaaD
VNATAADSTVARAREVAGSVPDPELPAVTLADLGILREVAIEEGQVVVFLAPTYSGCPALPEMRHDVRARLGHAGFEDVEIKVVLDPPWSTDEITAAGRSKLAAAGIAPPHPAPRRASGPVPLTLHTRRPGVSCPRCGSADTAQTSAFGATACIALYRCRACAEPFDYLKEL